MDIAEFKDRNYDTLVAGGVLLLVVQSYLVLPKRHWKQTASYLLHPSRNNTRVNRCCYPWQKIHYLD